MRARTSLARRTAPVLVAVAALALTGCGPESAAPGAGDDGTPVASESPAPSEPFDKPTEEPSAPSEEPSETTEPATGSLTDALLPAGEVPGFNDQFTWEELATDASEPRELAGTCHKFELGSIGAEQVAYRTFGPRPGGQATGSELVAQFPDEETAARAYAVLESWRKDCRDRLSRFDRVEVGDPVDVATDAGQAQWYLLMYGPVKGDPDAGYFDAQGIAQVGDRVAVLRLSLVGQDYNYEAGQEPMVAAVRAAAARL